MPSLLLFWVSCLDIFLASYKWQMFSVSYNVYKDVSYAVSEDYEVNARNDDGDYL